MRTPQPLDPADHRRRPWRIHAIAAAEAMRLLDVWEVDAELSPGATLEQWVEAFQRGRAGLLARTPFVRRGRLPARTAMSERIYNLNSGRQNREEVGVLLILAALPVSWSVHYLFERNTPAFFDEPTSKAHGASVAKKVQVALGGVLWSGACFWRAVARRLTRGSR